MKEYLFRFQEKLGYAEVFLKREKINSVESLNRVAGSLNTNDNEIRENIDFEYKVLLPDNKLTQEKPESHSSTQSATQPATQSEKYASAIILFHGLNERYWDKYIPWAQYLCTHTQMPVVLFPISMHINRSPQSWSNPRTMQKLVSLEKEREDKEDKEGKTSSNQNLTFVNYALSTRIKANPYRFYLAGRETVLNVCQLMEEIREGRSPIFSKECIVNIFSYSIGSLLSQVLLMSNPYGYFSESKLFMFCGGALFGEMNGNSRMIMDKASFEILNHYYRNQFIFEYIPSKADVDNIDNAFLAHIDKEFRQKERYEFYKKAYKRISAISLKKDIVIPTSGIKNAMGSIWKKCLKELDFPFKYSHEAPFPTLEKGASTELDYWFHQVFSHAAQFLKQ